MRTIFAILFISSVVTICNVVTSSIRRNADARWAVEIIWVTFCKNMKLLAICSQLNNCDKICLHYAVVKKKRISLTYIYSWTIWNLRKIHITNKNHIIIHSVFKLGYFTIDSMKPKLLQSSVELCRQQDLPYSKSYRKNKTLNGRQLLLIIITYTYYILFFSLMMWCLNRTNLEQIWGVFFASSTRKL